MRKQKSTGPDQDHVDNHGASTGSKSPVFCFVFFKLRKHPTKMAQVTEWLSELSQWEALCAHSLACSPQLLAVPAPPYPLLPEVPVLTLLPLSNTGPVRPGANFRNFCMEGYAVIPFLTGFSHYTHVCEVHPWCRVLYIAVLGPLQLPRVVPLCEYTRVSGVIAPECHHEMQHACEMKAGLRFMSFMSVA